MKVRTTSRETHAEGTLGAVSASPRSAVRGRTRAARGSRRWARIAEPNLRSRRLTAPPSLPPLTTGQWLARWLDQRATDGALGPRTEENYRAILRCHLVPSLGSIPLTDLVREDVAELKDELSEKLAPATVHKVLGLLRKSLNAAVIEDRLPHNPAESVPSPTVAGRSRERRALSASEITALLRAAAGKERRATSHRASARARGPRGARSDGRIRLSARK